jgi:uncharacterized protein YndB with AHSA1/START domain
MNKNTPNTLADIKQTMVFEAPIQKVWEAVSTSEGIAEWFMPNDFKAEIGHEFHLQSPFGPSPCKIVELDPPTSLSFTWDVEGWIITFALKELEKNQTEFTLIHAGWDTPEQIISKANEKNSVIRDRMNNGWTQILENLKKVVQA